MPRALLGLLGATLIATVFGCGGDQESAAAPKAPGTTRTTVYFLIDDGTAPIGVRRTIAKRHPWSREALNALLAGPTEAERRAGMTSAIPEGVRLLSIKFSGYAGGGATADLSSLAAVQDPVDTARVVTQIARTLIGVGSIERVRLRSDGRPWGFGSHEGRVIDRWWDYDLLTGLWVGPFKGLP
jgi:spore germination protein GerM